MTEDKIEKRTVQSNDVSNGANLRDIFSGKLSSLVLSIRETGSFKRHTTAKNTKLGRYRLSRSPYKSLTVPLLPPYYPKPLHFAAIHETSLSP
jgi:hypothetical protein